MNPETNPSVTNCGNCHSPMPKELRFCRNCGFRLGEGVAEYTETVRFQAVPAGTLGKNSSGAEGAPYGFAGGLAVSRGGPLKKRRRMSGMSWMFIGLLIFFIAAAGFTAVVKQVRPNLPGGVRTAVAPRSYAGVNGFETTEGGVTFDNVEPPGSPADKAGMVGGDIITTADGQPVQTRDDMMAVLRRTTIGKTIDIVYIRDGETKTTKLTTMSEQDSERLSEEFSSRPAGRGRFGFDDDNTERVPIPGTKMFGVRLDEISPSLPADMAGIKNGDIVIEFDGVPIRTTDELSARVPRAIPYDTVTVVVMRAGERLEIPVKMGRQ